MTTMLIVWLSLHVGNTVLDGKFEKVFQNNYAGSRFIFDQRSANELGKIHKETTFE